MINIQLERLWYRLFQYNQSKYADYIIKNGFSSKYLRMELKILALYYRDKGMPPKKRKAILYEMCNKYIEGFNRVNFFKLINSVVTYSSNKKNKLIDIDHILVTSTSLNYIDNLDVDYLCKKLLFGFIVFDKLGKVKWTIENEKESNNEHFFANNPSSYRNLTKSLSINKSVLRKYGYQKIYEVTHYLINKGLLEDTINNTKLLFLYNIPIDENISIEVKNYDNVGLYYDLHSGTKNVKKCENCSVPIKVKSNSAKYCEECKVKTILTKTAERVKKYRDVTK